MTTLKGEMESFEANPKRKTVKILLWVFAIVIMFGTLSYALSWCSESSQVAKQEFGAKAALEKYEWFKDASAKLEQKKADIKIYEQRIESLKKDYEGTQRKDWDRNDKETMNQWESELAGIKLSYNSLAAEYNAQSSKFNWEAFKTDIPKSYVEFVVE